MIDTDALREGLLRLQGPLFAVLDGAQFPDLPDTLLRSNLAHRCLYLDRGDNHPERLVTAPHMVELADRANGVPHEESFVGHENLDRLLDLLPAARAAAFWQCPDGGDALYRHLRGLNRVLVPRAGERADWGTGPADGTHEAVLFRHADANVLMQVTPALDARQLARLLGPARLLAFLPDGEAATGNTEMRVKAVRRDENWPAPVPGMLRIEPHQYDAMREARLHRSRLRLVAYLRDCAPDETHGLDDRALMQQVLLAERSGRELGLRSEAAHGQWAFLMITTGGRIKEGELVRRAVGEARDPDRAVTELMREMVRQAQNDARDHQTARR